MITSERQRKSIFQNEKQRKSRRVEPLNNFKALGRITANVRSSGLSIGDGDFGAMLGKSKFNSLRTKSFFH